MSQPTQVSIADRWSEFTRYWRWILGVLVVVALLGTIIVLVHFSTNVNVRVIFDDAAETGRLPEYAGLYSALGVIVLWSASLFGFIAARYGDIQTCHRRRFLVIYAVLIGFMALDDLLMFHEWVGLVLAKMTNADDIASTRSRLEGIVFAVYIVVGVVWAARSRRHILDSPWPLLLLGIAGFGLSISLDLLPYTVELSSQVLTTTLAVLEDLVKLVGIGGFALYGYHLAEPHLRIHALRR